MKLFTRKYNTPTGFDTCISAGVVIDGAMVFNGTVQMNGVFRGTQVNGDQNADTKIASVLVVGGTMNIEHLRVDTLEISSTGSVRGCKVSADTLIVRSKGVLEMAFIRYKTLVIETGALISGDLQHLDAEPAILREPSPV